MQKTQLSTWQEAHRAVRARQLGVARDLFARGAADGYPPAQCDLGRLMLHGLVERSSATADPGAPQIGMPSPTATPEMLRGLQWIRRAAQQDYAPAAFQLATLAMGGRLVPFDAQQIIAWVCAAARANHAPALRTLGVLYSLEGSMLGTLCLEHAARMGDELAMALLAFRLLQGRDAAQDAPRALAMIDLLIANGLPLAKPEPELPRSSPTPRNLPALPDLPPPQAPLHPPLPAPVQLCESPVVRLFPQAVGVEECLYVVLAGLRHVRPSVTADPDGKVAKVPLRTSDETIFDPLLEDVILMRMQRRMAAAAGLDVSHAEPLILLRYQPGQEYRLHGDYLPPSLVRPVSQGGGGQRQATVIAYLNSDLEGGATVFPRLGLRVPPRCGDLLHFRNVDESGAPDPRTGHAGEPVIAGVKWICTLWQREGPQRPF